MPSNDSMVLQVVLSKLEEMKQIQNQQRLDFELRENVLQNKIQQMEQEIGGLKLEVVTIKQNLQRDTTHLEMQLQKQNEAIEILKGGKSSEKK